MAYQSGKVYWICPVGNLSVALSVRGNSQVSQNRDVFLYTKEDIADQLWRIEVSEGYARIKSELDNRYALNIYLSTGNCDIHTWADNQQDSKINFRTIDASLNRYRIQNYRNGADNNLYLTASNSISGGLVTWTGLNSAAVQQWQLIEKDNTPVLTDYSYPTAYRGLSQYFHGVDHTGIDIRDKANDHNVYAFTDGVVVYAQHADDPSLSAGNKTMGNCVMINHFNPDYQKHQGSYARTVYMHMKDYPLHKVGDPIANGEKLGVIGSTGNSTGAHLHFVLAVGNLADMRPGEALKTNIRALPLIDPLTYLPEYHLDPGFAG